MKFKLNEWVVYPSHGIGQITKAEVKEVFGKVQEFFTIELISNNMKILVPSDNVGSVGLRKILSKGQINKAFALVKDIKTIDESRWEKRYRSFHEQINSGDFLDMLTVFKQLNGIKDEFDLSFGERKMLDALKELVTEEVSLAYNISREFALDLVYKSI